jgi:hypothetical protein
MYFRLAIPLSLLFYVYADVPDLPRVVPAQSAAQPKADAFTSEDRIPLYPSIIWGGDAQDQDKSAAAGKKSDNLTEMSKLSLIRYVSGEFAKAKKPLPGGKDGFTFYADKPLDQQSLDHQVTLHGAAVNTGDPCQITRLEFREHTIVVDVNGGGRPKSKWWEHIQFGMGGDMPTTQTTTTTEGQEQGPPGFQEGRGGTIYLQFPKNVPDLTPEELKGLLSPFLDFSNEKSASVHWIDTLPPEMKKAITDRRAVVGMDRDEVVAAIGKPDRKVRERDAQGNDTEDWIYGHPPDKTVFVHFTGEKVTGIKQYPE